MSCVLSQLCCRCGGALRACALGFAALCGREGLEPSLRAAGAILHEQVPLPCR